MIDAPDLDIASSSRQVFHGLGASPGCAVGSVRRVSTGIALPDAEQRVDDAEQASTRIAEIFELVAADLEACAERLQGEVHDILTATAAIARDPTLLQMASDNLRYVGPATAIHRAVGDMVNALSAAGPYWAERSTDLLDIRDRAVARWLGAPAPSVVGDGATPAIITALDLAPADVAMLDPELVLGVITERGGPTAHMAIITSQLGIPCIVQAAGVTAIPDGTPIAMDGGSGEVTIAPSDEKRASVERRIARQQSVRSHTSGPGLLADGTHVALYVNLGAVAEAERLGATDVEGVGLFRTEFLYGGRDTEPSVAEQSSNYERVLSAFGDRPVTFRTLDIGADKPLPFAERGPEANPALGVRGLRHSRQSVDLLDHQLEALATANRRCGGSLRVMAPMVSSRDEARWFAERCASHGLAELGVMIEVPAAALRSKDVLDPVSFGSLGTNDLSQYVMAADRTVGELAHLLSPWQPALLDLIVSSVAGAGDKPVGACGEAAGDPLMALVLVGLGVTSLSMSPARIAAVRYALSLHSLARCQEIARAALSASDALSGRTDALKVAAAEMLDLL